ncbi:MAG: hypothetical protein M9964_09245 [Solirubrobacterales bacterium]|nr:hypothetical protein [Solirubrobacterales bacterium]
MLADERDVDLDRAAAGALGEELDGSEQLPVALRRDQVGEEEDAEALVARGTVGVAGGRAAVIGHVLDDADALRREQGSEDRAAVLGLDPGGVDAAERAPDVGAFEAAEAGVEVAEEAAVEVDDHAAAGEMGEPDEDGIAGESPAVLGDGDVNVGVSVLDQQHDQGEHVLDPEVGVLDVEDARVEDGAVVLAGLEVAGEGAGAVDGGDQVHGGERAAVDWRRRRADQDELALGHRGGRG